MNSTENTTYKELLLHWFCHASNFNEIWYCDAQYLFSANELLNVCL